MRVANLTHGAYFMLGAYVGLTLLNAGQHFLVAVAAGAGSMALLGGVVERLVLRRLAGQSAADRTRAQVLVTLGLAFVIADGALWLWGGEAFPLPVPPSVRGIARMGTITFPVYRLVVIAVALIMAVVLWLMLERTRLGAMIRAAVDNTEMARGMGIPVSRLFTSVFCLGAGLAGMGGVLGGPILSVYPGLDNDMLPLALVVVILGGMGSFVGAFVGSFVIGFIYTFGQTLLPDLAYVILFLPMVIVLVARPHGLFGRAAT